MPTLDPRAHLRSAIERTHRLLVNDLNAIDEEKGRCLSRGVARPAIEMVAECAGVNLLIATFLTTGQANRRTPEEREAYYAQFKTREAVLAVLAENTQKLLEAIDTMDENTMGEESDTLFGRPMTRFAMAGMAAMHMMYHDGQLNYIQCLHGDDAMHW